MSLQEIKNKLQSCSYESCESVCDECSNAFEEDLLGIQGFPDEYFTFVIELLSIPLYYSKQGVWQFILAISSETHRLDTWHKDRLKGAIRENYKYYLDEMLCHMICDFIARIYEPNEAIELFEELSNIEKTKDRQYVPIGVEIVLKNTDPSSEAHRRALRMFDELKRTGGYPSKG